MALLKGTLDILVLKALSFTIADRAGSEPVTIVSRAMAHTFWPGRSAVGECVYWGTSKDSLNTCSPRRRCGGRRARVGPQGAAGAQLLRPVRPGARIRWHHATRAPGAETEVNRAVHSMMLSIDPSISFVSSSSMQDAIDPQVRPWKLGAAVFTLMGVLALVVAAVGLYSVMSYFVAQRTREIGVRGALGAQASSIVGLVMRSSLALAAAGVAIGMAITLWAGRWLAPLLFDTSARDPGVMIGVTSTMIGVAVAASIIPALRAKRVDPMEALRSE